MIVYLVRHRGVHHICRPGVVSWREEGTVDSMVARLAWVGRDDSALVCFDGEADDITQLEDDEALVSVAAQRQERQERPWTRRSPAEIAAGLLPMAADAEVEIELRDGSRNIGPVRKFQWGSLPLHENEIVDWRRV